MLTDGLRVSYNPPHAAQDFLHPESVHCARHGPGIPPIDTGTCPAVLPLPTTATISCRCEWFKEERDHHLKKRKARGGGGERKKNNQRRGGHQEHHITSKAGSRRDG